MNSDENLREKVLARLGSKYSYIGKIGEGAFSYVYRLRHNLLGEDHALKIMNSKHILQKIEKEDIKASPQNYEKIKIRFLEEARLYKKIDHPGLVKIYDVDVIELSDTNIEIPYMIMKYIEGQNLKNFLETRVPLEFSKVIKISIAILETLGAIHHSNIVHRDIKPANIVIESESGKPVLIDFGLAKDLIRDNKLTTTGKVLGTPLYMSPEQFTDSSRVGPRSDIYSFGVIFYELLTGEPPFTGKSVIEVMLAHLNGPIPDVREKRSTLPLRIEEIVKKSLEKNPENRFENVEEMLRELIKFRS